jgi:PST family polysaccharide transporter
VLLEITPVAGLAFLFTGIAAQHLALLRRQMRFSILAASQGGTEIVGILAAVVAALAGAGIWALVAQRLAWAAANAAVAWLACAWRPGRPGPVREVRDFVAFGGNATASMMVSYLAGYLDNVLIGWYSGTGALGLYERSQRLLLLPIRNLNVPLGGVVIAALSRLHADPARYRALYLGTVERLAMVIAPVGGLLLGAAGPAVAIVLGPQWTDAAPILMWMAPMALYQSATYALSWLYMSQDRTPEMLRAGTASAGLALLAIVGGLTFGPAGVAAALMISGLVVRAPLLFWLVGRAGPVRTRDLYAVLATPAAAFVTVAAATTAARRLLTLDAIAVSAEVAVLLAVSLVSAAAVYLIVPRTRRAIRGLARLPRVLGRMAPKAA